MNVLLVYPEYPDTFWGFKKALHFVHKKAVCPPLGILTVASMLPEEWDLKLADLNIGELKDEDIAWSDMVFVSAMIAQRDSTIKVIKRAKELGRIVIAGGPAFISEHEKYSGVDHFVLDEAEVTLQPFLDDLKAGTLKHIYSSKERPDITKTPIPMWSLIDFKDYFQMVVQYSRGCPFDCEFCDIVALNGRFPRTKTPEQVIAEFQALYDAGWRGDLLVVDDNFIGNKVNVKKMLRELISWQKNHKYPFKLDTEASINLADDEELMDLMSAANFNKVFLGIETPCVESLKECGKLQNANTDLAQSVKRIMQHGMQVKGGFIVGFDNDPPGIFDAQIKFIQQTGVVVAMVGLLKVGPHTRLWNRLQAEGRLLKETDGNNCISDINYVPKMGKEKLLEGYKQIISITYSPRSYYQRINTFVKCYRPTVKYRLTRMDFYAYLRSIWEIGVISRSRMMYWGLIFRTLFTNNRALPSAVELAIYWTHFESVAKGMVEG